MLKVEIAVAEAQMKNHVIPEANLETLKMVLKSGIDEPRMREIEKETKHDIMAFIRTVEEQSNHAFKFLHFGLTSNDVIDTAMALQLKEFYTFLMEDLKDIQASLLTFIASLPIDAPVPTGPIALPVSILPLTSISLSVCLLNSDK